MSFRIELQKLLPLNHNIITKKRVQRLKMSNSFELLQGPIADIQKKYEILSDIVIEYGGKVHGSQRDRNLKISLIDLLVYYEVPEGQRDEVRRKFENLVRNQVALHRNY